MDRKGIKEAIAFACEANGVPEIIPRISVQFNPRFTNRMGDALFNGTIMRIRLSTPLWGRASDEQKRETVIHEACHIIARYKHGLDIRPHGYHWISCMKKAGIKL